MGIAAMQVWLIAKLLMLLTAANGSPVILKSIVGDRWARPLDGGLKLADGQPLFGRSKTIRGIVIALLATTAAALALGLGWQTGAMVGGVAMAGDLMSSFVKRRLKLPSSSRASGLDQVPESLLPTAAAALFLPLTTWDIVIVVALFVAGEVVISWIFFRIGIRDRPY
jgi:CDP-2,3-bis-(O-geranylgeranyl)-sn-glycerol synthase